ncbi:MAG: 5-dehydro-2-deoxygluconokinase [Rhizobiales bacterium]|nr:5-dehydro-2-deoxygluconokinase [Hyphomicrobiales bacterium]
MSAAQSAILDVVTIGRSSVDLYGKQIGTRLEDLASFTKAVGGCPTNIAIGSARLGLKAAVITGVGDEQMGRFIREQLAREGVSTAGVKVDPKRLTALVLLSVENDTSFPLIFYRENCADMALEEGDISEALILSAKAVLVTGTHFSKPNTEAAQRKAMRIARAAGRRVAFDIDYRPNLWGLAGHAAGEERYIASDTVSARLQTVLPECDLIIGTEEEIRIAGGKEDTLEALRRVRELSAATIVLKRGPMGCVVYEGAMPARIEDGIIGKGFPVEVYNVLGAGDAFMSGFLRGWLTGEPAQTCATWANACGAFAVSRLLCAPEYPTWEELTWFLAHGSSERALRKDAALNHIHWATTRRLQPATLTALAIDHRAQLEALADRLGVPRTKINGLKTLAVKAAAETAKGSPGYGMLLDEVYGREALFAAARLPFWIGRPVEQPGSRPLRFEFSQDIGARLAEWPVTHTVKCLAFFHPDDDEALRREQTEKLATLYDAARRNGLELLIEIIASKHGAVAEDTTSRVLEMLYAAGIKPDWWKLEAQPSTAAWAHVERVIAAHDPFCRGVVLLGLEAPEAELEAAFAATKDAGIVKGFAIGRTIFNDTAEKWLAGSIDDQAAVDEMAGRFTRLAEAWKRARA